MLEIIKSIIRRLRYDLRRRLYEGSTLDFPDCSDRELANGKQTEVCTVQQFKNPSGFFIISLDEQERLKQLSSLEKQSRKI